MYKNPVNSYPANAAFNKANSPLNASDYIQYKKTVYSFCSPNLCKPNKNVGPSSNLQLLKVANNAAFYPCKDSFDNTQLYSNLYTIQLIYTRFKIIRSYQLLSSFLY